MPAMPYRWASPLADVNKDALSTTFRRYRLPALASTPTASYIRVRTDWVNDNILYIEYRLRGWGDMQLVNDFNNRVVVHRVNVPGLDNDLTVRQAQYRYRYTGTVRCTTACLERLAQRIGAVDWVTDNGGPGKQGNSVVALDICGNGHSGTAPWCPHALLGAWYMGRNLLALLALSRHGATPRMRC